MGTYCIAWGTLLSGDQNGKQIQKWRMDMADSLCCTAETNTTL